MTQRKLSPALKEKTRPEHTCSDPEAIKKRQKEKI